MTTRLKLAAAMGAILAAPAHAGVMWEFNFTDAGGVGFNDVAEGAMRQTGLQTAADYVSSFLTDYNAVIQMDVDGSTTSTTTLAAAGTNYNGAAFSAGFNDQGDIQKEILTGIDVAPAQTDGTVTWNFTNFDWEFGTDFQAGEFDFFSTAVHELLHALGFASNINQDGTDQYGTTSGNTGSWAPFDEYLTDASGTSIIDQATFALNQAIWDDTSVSMDGSGTAGCDAGIKFTGANAVAANGGQAVQIYSPNPWEGGSSGSHLDDNCYTLPGNVSTFMMEAQTIDGLGVRTISDLEVGIFKDIGYTMFGQRINAIPEPSTLLLMFGSVVGLIGIRRRGKVNNK